MCVFSGSLSLKNEQHMKAYGALAFKAPATGLNGKKLCSNRLYIWLSKYNEKCQNDGKEKLASVRVV